MLARSFWLIALAAWMNITLATPGRAADAVNVATPSIVIFAIPYGIAEQKGYFKDENIDPTLEVVANQREIAQRVLNGASQFSITGPDATIVDATQGGPSRILAGWFFSTRTPGARSGGANAAPRTSTPVITVKARSARRFTPGR